jgi:hypothetical protein
MISRRISILSAAALVAAAPFLATPAAAQEEFKIGVVASLTGGLAGPAKD